MGADLRKSLCSSIFVPAFSNYKPMVIRVRINRGVSVMHQVKHLFFQNLSEMSNFLFSEFPANCDLLLKK